MGRKYAVDGSQNASTTAAAATILVTGSATTIRPKIYDIVIGSAAAPADQAFNVQWQRFTTAGTTTAVTPTPLDPGDPASAATCGENSTVVPTYTSGEVLLSASFNQQATFRWVAAPGGEMLLPATAANGIGSHFIVVSGGSALTEETLYFEE